MYKELLKPVHFLPAAIVGGVVLAFILALIIPVFRILLVLVLGGMVAIALLAFLQSFSKYKSLKVSFLSIATLYTQVFAYGLGTWSALFQVWRGKEVAEGFVKKYYK
jgi:hypothetical protein